MVMYMYPYNITRNLYTYYLFYLGIFAFGQVIRINKSITQAQEYVLLAVKY